MGSGFSREPLALRKRPEDASSRVPSEDRDDGAAARVEVLPEEGPRLWGSHATHRGELRSDVINDLVRRLMCLTVSSM